MSSTVQKQPYGFKDMIGHFITVYLISAAVVGALNALCLYFFGTYLLVTVVIFPLFFAGLFWGFRTKKKLGRIPPLLMKLKFLIFTYPISALSTALLVWYYATFDPSALGVVRGILLVNTLQFLAIFIGFTFLGHLGIVLMIFRNSDIEGPDHEYWRRQSYKWGLRKMSKRNYWITAALLLVVIAALIYLRIKIAVAL